MSQRYLPGMIFADRYQLLECLGRGGMGTVFSAQHVGLAKKFAIKILHGHLCTSLSTKKRFAQEAKAASAIEHQNIIEVVDAGVTADDTAFFVMEYLKGEDLATTFRRDCPMPWLRVRRIVLQICEALQAAHDLGIIHRDVKPANCFRISRNTNNDFIKILDFGIAKVIADDHATRECFTATGDILGTIKYMAPEQARGLVVDQRTDVYSVGVILYQALTGRLPYPGNQLIEVLAKILQGPPSPPSALVPSLPAALDRVILRALNGEPEERFPSMQALAHALDEIPDVPAVAVPVTDREESSDDRGADTTNNVVTLEAKTRVKRPPALSGIEAVHQSALQADRHSRRVLGIVVPALLVSGGLMLGMAPWRETRERADEADSGTHDPPPTGGQAVSSSAPAPAPPAEPLVAPEPTPGDRTATEVPNAEPQSPAKSEAKKPRTLPRPRPSARLESPVLPAPVDCANVLSEATAARNSGRVRRLYTLATDHVACWSDPLDALELEVHALKELNKWEGCKKRGAGHPGQAVKSLVAFCTRRALLELPTDDTNKDDPDPKGGSL